MISNPLIVKGSIEYREYQDSLKLSILENGNTLLVAPTALGKTIVALLCAVERLSDPNSKVIFLSPTKPLAQQHMHTFSNFLELNSFYLMI